jgi:predicted ATPase/DNA-binding SARP family transcriptional activator
VEIRLLSRFDVVREGTEVPLGGPRQRAVLAVLAIHADEIVSIDRLVEDVWSGEPPPTATTTLQRYVSHLRRALEGLPVCIETRRPGYVLRVDPELVDARRFERLVGEGRRLLGSGAVEEAASVLQGALALWRGEPLADFAYEEFARLESARLDELRLTAVELRVDADLALGRHQDLVAELESLVAAHPLRESFRGQLMRALYGSGRRAEALRVYSEGRRLLAEELGLDPSSGLQRLEQAILMGDPAVEQVRRRVVGRVGQLPAEVTSFVGRAVEVGEVTEALARSRLVTLTGVGGSGKSRLALRVATDSAPSLPGGAWLVELAGISDPALVLRAFATALGVREDADRDLLDTLLDAFREQHCLVVVDGCEHLLDAVAPLVERLLEDTVALQVLATSREPIGVPGEVAYRVPTLPVDDAARLFVERAASTDSSFRLGEDVTAAVAEVCRRLDGIPLAIELAAARMDVLTPRQLADRLDDRFSLLSDARRTVLPRQRTLRATIDWSYALLDDAERLLFDRLAVFAGSFGVDAAEAVCTDEQVVRAEVVDVLARLVRKSLVVRVDSGAPAARYRLLDTIREYGLGRLCERGEADALHAGHAAWFTAQAERLAPATRGPAAGRLLDELDSEQVEFNAALAWLLDRGDGEAACRLAAALVPYWDTRFQIREARLWLERSVATSGDAPPTSARLWAQVGVAYFAFMEGAFMEHDMSDAFAACDEAARLLEAVPDPAAEAKILTIRGDLARYHDELDAAEEHCRRATEMSRRLGDAWSQADASRILALVAMDRGDTVAGVATATSCLRLYQSCGDIEKTAGAQVLLGQLARDSGQFARAAELFEQGLAGFQQVGERLGAAFALWMLADCAAMLGDVDAARRWAEECLRANEELGFRRGMLRARHLLADAAALAGDLDRAERWCASALAGFRERGYHRDLIEALETLAVIRLQRGDPDAAAEAVDEALGHAQLRGYGKFVRRLLRLLASVRVRQDRVDEAVAVAEEARADAERAGDRRERATALLVLAEADVARGRGEEARAHLAAAEAELRDAGASFTWREAREHDRLRAAADGQLGTTTSAR